MREGFFLSVKKRTGGSFFKSEDLFLFIFITFSRPGNFFLPLPMMLSTIHAFLESLFFVIPKRLAVLQVIYRVGTFHPLSWHTLESNKHITQLQKTFYGYRLYIYWIHGYNSGWLAFLSSLVLLSSSGPQVLHKSASTKMKES